MAVPLMFQPLLKYAQFEGRSRRSEFWLWVLFRFLLGQLLGAIAMAIIGPMFAQMSRIRKWTYQRPSGSRVLFQQPTCRCGSAYFRFFQ